MAEQTMGNSYLMNYYLGRQSIIEFSYKMALQEAKMEEQKRELLREQQGEIQDTIKEYEMLRLKIKAEQAKASGNASAIISGYIGIGNIKAKEKANRIRAAEIAQDKVTAPARTKTFILNSSSDRAGQMGSKAQAEAFLDTGGTQFAEVNQALSGLTAEQRYDAVLNLADQVNAEMIGDGAASSDRAAVKSLVFAKYLPGVTSPTRADYNTKAQAVQAQLASQAGTLPTSKLNTYLDTLTGGSAANAQTGVDALVEASLSDDGNITTDDSVYIQGAKGLGGVGAMLKDAGFLSYDFQTATMRAKKRGESQQAYDAATADFQAKLTQEVDTAMLNYFQSRMGATPDAQIAMAIGKERAQLGIVQDKLAKDRTDFQQLFGEKITEVMTPEMRFDTKTTEGRKAFKMFEMNRALEAQMMKMTPEQRANYQIALTSAEDFENIGYENSLRKYSQFNQEGKEYAETTNRGIRNGTVDKNNVIPAMEKFLRESTLAPQKQQEFRASALGLIYLDQYRTKLIEGKVPDSMKTDVKQPATAPEEGFKGARVPKRAVDKAFPETGDPSKTGF